MKFELIEDWKKAHALYSMWFFAALGVAPQLFDLAVSMHVIDGATAPAALTKLINIIAFCGAASRIVQQKCTVPATDSVAAEPAADATAPSAS